MRPVSTKKIELAVIGAIVTALSILLHSGCATLKKTIAVDTPETKPADSELRRKLEEWTALLHSPDPTIRSSAAVSLLGINLLNAQEPLVKILTDRKEREDIQVSVIKAFGFTKDDRATDVLINLLDSESVLIQAATAEALGGLRTKKSIHTMSDAMLDPRRSLTTKILLAKALGNTNDRDTVESLIRMLAVDDPGLRQASRKSLEKVTKQAGDNDSAWWKDWWSRNKSKTREQWLEDIVLKQEENNRQQEAKLEQLRLEVSQKSIKLLETRTDKTDPKTLMEALKSEYPDVRIFAAKELAKIKEASVIDVLIDAALDKQEEVRIEVVQRLGEIGDERAVKPLIDTLDDESLVVREKAARALGLLRKPEATEPLISTLHSNTNLLITCAIIDALGQIGDTRAIDPLITFLSHQESKIRECAAASLGGIRNARAVEPLIDALSDEQERVRWYAADSLGKIGNPVCVDALIKLLTDTSARVRESAVTALGQMGNQQAIESLTKATQDVDKRVSEQASESLINIKNMSFDAMDTVATVFYNSKDYRRAEILLERQLTEYANKPELQEKILQSRIKLAKTLYAIKDWQKALGLYEELVKRFPNDDLLKTEIIQCLKETRQFGRAMEWYTVWTKESPQNNPIYWQGRLDIVKVVLEQGRYDDAKGFIDILKSEDPNLGGEKFLSQFLALQER